ncbi:MAG: lipid A deacylase LpxR family protein [Verrucomicrobiae bacterium]|nr:lipid A deacylase LpxR family protein [Verrucomicrobiae bacterium]NNJ85656.1 lipid A deacylase LpxR family protein [Akkermansiaceae bacterium]
MLKLPMNTLLVVAGFATLSIQVDAGEKSVILPEDHSSSVAHDGGGYLTFFLDNDLFTGTDSNYTNGARISYITEGKPLIDIPFVQKNLERLSGDGESAGWIQKIWGFQNPREVEYSYGFALTQLMFTPETRESLTPPPGEHPYAGWLGIGFSLHARDAHALNSVEISFGITGKHSYAQESQDFIHELRDIEKFQGWDSQIPEEFTVNIDFNQRRCWVFLDDVELPLNLEIDGFHETGYSFGNYLTAAHIGGLVRFGWNLPVEFSDPRLTTSAHTQKLYSDESVNSKRWSFYVLAGARASGILHDITLDGPVFRSFDTGVDREPLVGELYAGFGARYRGWELGYVHTYRSKRFKTQKDPQAFGSVSVRTHF